MASRESEHFRGLGHQPDVQRVTVAKARERDGDVYGHAGAYEAERHRQAEEVVQRLVLTSSLAAFDLAHGVPDLHLREVLQGTAEHRLEVGVVARGSAEAADLDVFAEH